VPMMIFYKFVQTKVGSWAFTWCLAHCSFLLPIKKVAESDQLIAFHHPRPSYPVHILLIPKKYISGINEITKKNYGILLEVMHTARKLARDLDPNRSGHPNRFGHRLILNAGAYQEVPQLHFHLILDESSKSTSAS